MTSSKHISVCAYLRKDQKAALDKLSKETGEPMSEFIRSALDAYLKKRASENSLPASTGQI